MRVIPIHIANQLAAGGRTTLAYLWRVQLRDGTVLGFTSHDRDIARGGVTYRASTGFAPTAMVSAADGSVDNLNVKGPLLLPGMSREALEAGTWDGARIVLLQVDYTQPDAGAVVLRTGVLGEVRAATVGYEAELRGLLQVLQQPLGEVYTAACRFDLGDARCTVDMTPFTHTGSVTTADDVDAFTSASISAQAAGYFASGLLTFTSGDNAGLTYEVSEHEAGGSIVLYVEPAFAIDVGDEFVIKAGCDKAPSTCNGKFNNIVNYGGFPHVPGQEVFKLTPQK